MKKPFRKGDLWLLGSILLTAALLLLFRAHFSPKGKYVSVSVNDVTVKVFDITSEVDQYIEGIDGKNRIRVENGKVWIEEADCPEGICQHHTPISRVGDSIICLPHRLVVTIIGDGEYPDAVVS